jgi:predicted ATPase
MTPMAGNRETPTLPKLRNDWASARNTASGWPLFLEAVSLDGVRGWATQWVEFRFPVVAIAGENGSGKSTVLKAAAAAYKPAHGNHVSVKDFSPDDFFPTTPWETVSGVTLEYRVRQGDQVATHRLRKASARWRGMPERPQRTIYFLDISRTQPVDTLIGYGKIARVEMAANAPEIQIDTAFLGMLSRVLGRTYAAGSLVRDERGKQVGIVEYEGDSYSNFHQGAGEDATTDLVALLQDAPRNSLILIDEVEASLHPRAQRRLMTELIRLAGERRLQLVVSTHSPYVLEQLPPEARIYLRSTRDGRREPLYGVTPEYALSLMDDERHPELVLYCEDQRAVPVVEGLIRATDPSLIPRVKIVAVGPASTVKMLGALIDSERLPEQGVGVLDADQEASPGCVRLPGLAAAPEVAVFGGLSDEHYTAVAERLGVRAGDLMDAVEDAQRLPNHHTWPGRTAERLGGTIRTTRVWEAFVDVWVRDVLDPEERATFVHEIASQIPPMGAGGAAD